MKVLFLGPPGAGKSSYAKFMTKNFNFSYLSTGEILRDEVEKQTNLGKIAQKFIGVGNFVPDDVIVEVVLSKLKSSSTSQIILDGFPRNLNQADILASAGFYLDVVLEFFSPPDILFKRLKNRSVIEGRKDDSSDDAIRHRLALYLKETYPLVKHYDDRDMLYSLDASGSLEDVNFKLRDLFNKIGM